MDVFLITTKILKASIKRTKDIYKIQIKEYKLNILKCKVLVDL